MIRALPALMSVLMLAACSPATTPDAQAAVSALAVSGAQVRASLGDNPNTGGYLTVTNSGEGSDRLVAAACACAERVELHTMSTEGGVMRMGQVEGFDVPASGALTLAPGGDHLMFLGLHAPLQAGEQVSVTLTFEQAGEIEAGFDVVTTPADAHGGHGG